MHSLQIQAGRPASEVRGAKRRLYPAMELYTVCSGKALSVPDTLSSLLCM